MPDLKFERKSSLSRAEAAALLSALASALTRGGEVELELGSSVLSMRVPDELRTEVEVEADDGEIELELEFKWSTARATDAAPKPKPKSGSRSGEAASTGDSRKPG
ncbi:amphi-Trp domain-containing protein [Embleya sp. NPDC020630]|uniref:amphi-Trp domain-containing protein n=1 Tax=Embleya sp. NPDC020630 TaxID=3363979 RepID=UPI00379BE95C